MADAMQYKKTYGQYYTISNPFKHVLFKEWCGLFDKKETIVEPFAGSNNIPRLMHEAGFDYNWTCYDIDVPKDNTYPKFEIEERDTIDDFPCEYYVCVSNPPYLAKVSASRLHLDYPKTDYSDLYMVCLDKMLFCCDYVAVIIPESFITADIFHERLYGVISLNTKMFDDTDCPVCLALFVPEKRTDFKIYVGDEYLGTYNELSKYKLDEYNKNQSEWVFNDPKGILGVNCIDTQNGDNIYFHHGDLIDPSLIKISSRSFSRIGGLPDYIDLDTFISHCNVIIDTYRYQTKDVFMTSFKGLRNDGKYRRRIDFKTVRQIMNKALSELNKQL